jgi:hypothetical protein
MKTMFLAAVAILPLGISSAFAESERQAAGVHAWRAMTGQLPTYVAPPLTSLNPHATVTGTSPRHAYNING